MVCGVTVVIGLQNWILPTGLCVGLWFMRLPSFRRDFRVDVVSTLPLFRELLARCRRFAVMRGRSLLQPGRFGGLRFGLGLRGTGLGSCFIGKRLPPFDSGCLQLGLFANLLGLPLAP